jgi:hypothetical protein
LCGDDGVICEGDCGTWYVLLSALFVIFGRVVQEERGGDEMVVGRREGGRDWKLMRS